MEYQNINIKEEYKFDAESDSVKREVLVPDNFSVPVKLEEEYISCKSELIKSDVSSKRKYNIEL